MNETLIPQYDYDCLIKTISTSELSYQSLSFNKMKMSDAIDTNRAPFCQLFKIDQSALIGYLPSRIWWDKDRGFVMMYYINSHVTAKPFGDKPAYVWAIHEYQGLTLSYDIRAKIFIDQVKGEDDQIYYLFIVGEDELAMFTGDDLPTVQSTAQSIDDVLNVVNQLQDKEEQDRESRQ